MSQRPSTDDRQRLAKRRRSRRRWVLGALVVGTALWAAWPEPLRWPAYLLIRDDPIQDEDGVTLGLILMGDASGMRASKARQLHRDGKVKRLAVCETRPSAFVTGGFLRPESETVAAWLTAQGVPSEAIIHLRDCAVTSTVEEARCLRTYLAASEPDTRAVAVITSWSHSGRAGWIFRKTFADSGIRVLLQPAMDVTSTPGAWWTTEGGVLATFDEYLKWGYWLTKL